jgi:hypothetical protein
LGQRQNYCAGPRSQLRRPSPRLTAGPASATPSSCCFRRPTLRKTRPLPATGAPPQYPRHGLSLARSPATRDGDRAPLAVEEGDAAPSATDDGDAGVLGRQLSACEHHLPCLRLRLLPPLLGTQGTPFPVLLGLPIAKPSALVIRALFSAFTCTLQCYVMHSLVVHIIKF